MKSINSALIPPKQKEVLWKFVNRGLFVGTVGHNYLTNIKKVPPTDTAKSMPNFCIYSHLINLTHQDPSYQWIFWDSPVATYLWTHVRQILHLINQTLEISSPYEIPLLFLPNLDSPPDLHTLNRQNIITMAFYTLYTSELKLTRQFQQQKLTHDAHLQQWPREVYGFFIEALQHHIQLTPLFSDELYRRINTLIRKVNQ